MLTEITLKNFKCFKEKTQFPLSKINLLTGVNGGGKSSLLQILLLFKQSKNVDILYLNGNCTELGSLQDIRNSETALGMPIKIRFKREYEIEIYHFFTQDFKNKGNKLMEINLSDRFLKLKYGAKVSLDKNNKLIDTYRLPHDTSYCNFDDSTSISEYEMIHYIAADRLGPQNFYLYTNPDFYLKVDKQGQFAPFVLFNKKDELVHNLLCLGQDSQTALQQTEEWLNTIFDGAKVALKAERDTIMMSYNTKQTPNRYKPSNVGFGYSYILPIIISGLIAKEGEILIVENPEAHLHPAAQSRLTKFLAKVASCGVQVFIETHSEHILNALRVVSVSKDYEIKNTDISVLYFQNNDNQPVMQIPINAKGGIDYWPENFFDQEEQDLSEIFKLTRKK